MVAISQALLLAPVEFPHCQYSRVKRRIMCELLGRIGKAQQRLTVTRRDVREASRLIPVAFAAISRSG
jgi:hypothetical protein